MKNITRRDALALGSFGRRAGRDRRVGADRLGHQGRRRAGAEPCQSKKAPA